MGIYEVRKYFNENCIFETIIEFDVSSATVELAAKALGVAPKRIAKTLTFQQGESAILLVAAGDARVDNRKFRETFGQKAKMLPPERVNELTGHPVGGVCPFALEHPLKVYLDASLKRFDTVYPAAGSPASCVVITPDRLQTLTDAKWVDVCNIAQ
ncbi:MAG TPA: YbaK/EbsC family protein [Clostridia bacterium]|nr:MAG: Cys-tRNA(Pro)/Cys-tRNA(Cys) deacylase YbaK [Firmicutes bacterium ADurb.Bin356]HOR13672.1 YbaK/EbsC family protein [Clostridia bacterium]